VTILHRVCTVTLVSLAGRCITCLITFSIAETGKVAIAWVVRPAVTSIEFTLLGVAHAITDIVPLDRVALRATSDRDTVISIELTFRDIAVLVAGTISLP
ncbi:MAG: hypothetical protein V2I33_18315, partial [Kangiellaceae bacterium]|nr:hypothetical protein [Kangiellaceae bacterium]